MPPPRWHHSLPAPWSWPSSYSRHITTAHSISVLRCPRRSFYVSAVLHRTPGQGHTRHLISEGRTTGPPLNAESDTDSVTPSSSPSPSPFTFETAYSIFAKRPSRPFPPPFLSLPSGSFSDPLTNHTRARARHPSVHGQLIRGITNGDDAIVVGGGTNFLATNDGVGQWAQKEKGHAALWSRLIAHFWVGNLEGKLMEGKGGQVESGNSNGKGDGIQVEDLDMIGYLQRALEQTKEVTDTPNGEIQGTTTAAGALLHHRVVDGVERPVILATNVGDCAIWVVRPGNDEPVYKSKEQWHWFDCPRQLGTNSPDQPKEVAVMDVVDIELGDLVLCLSDGVTDNLWDNEICEKVTDTMGKWKRGEEGSSDGLVYVARELMKAAREVAEDPDAGSPYMERALDEGIPAEGGKLDDISVLIGLCKKRDG